MTVVLDLEPEIESRVAAAAAARGLTIDEYVRALVGETVSAKSDEVRLPLPPRPNPHLTPGERAAAWLESGKLYPADLPVLSEWAMSRDSMYPDEY